MQTACFYRVVETRVKFWRTNVSTAFSSYPKISLVFLLDYEHEIIRVIVDEGSARVTCYAWKSRANNIIVLVYKSISRSKSYLSLLDRHFEIANKRFQFC